MLPIQISSLWINIIVQIIQGKKHTFPFMFSQIFIIKKKKTYSHINKKCLSNQTHYFK